MSVFDGLDLSLEDPETKFGKLLRRDRLIAKAQIRFWLLMTAVELPMTVITLRHSFTQDCKPTDDCGCGIHISVYMAVNLVIWTHFLHWLALNYRARFMVSGITKKYL